MNELKISKNFQELSYEESVSVDGGFHFAVGAIRDVQILGNFALNLAANAVEAVDSVIGFGLHIVAALPTYVTRFFHNCSWGHNR